MRMNRKGFTLVELMIVLAILGLLGGIGIPRYLQTLERARVASNATIVAMVQSAVDGFRGETGADLSVLRTAGGNLNPAAAADSLLGPKGVTLLSFIEVGEPDEGNSFPTNFRSITVTDENWYITADGKVYVMVGDDVIPSTVEPDHPSPDGDG